LANVELRYRNNPAKAVAIVDDLRARAPLDSIPLGDRAFDDLARLYASAGRPDRARELVAAAERSGLLRLRGPKPDRRWTLGTIALAEKRPADAVVELTAAAERHECAICPLPDLARAYEALGMADSAIAVYQRYVTLPWEWRFEPDAINLGFALDRLGRLELQQSDARKAADPFGRLLRLWHAADPELAPVLAEARRDSARR
jgi:tetratricopeptide (TPR) repeat protein